MEPIVQTTSGKVRGQREGAGFAFRGIPYAAPPVGALRFQAPAAPQPWDGVRDALEQGPTAPQFEGGPPPIIPDPHFVGDDYLNLNLFTPDLGAAGSPVLVFIHGGGYTAGSNSSPWFHGGSFNRDGVVVVNINYRLGIEGFLAVEGGASNRAVRDCVAALEWVRDNIAAFGGDPAQVTISGQSAGGGMVTALMAVPSARGLFRRAIPISGTANMEAPVRTADVARKVGEQLGVAPSCMGLSGVSPERLIEAQIAITAGGARLPLRPYADGEFQDAMDLDRARAGQAKEIDLLVGATREEFNPMMRTEKGIENEAAFARIAATGLPLERARRYRDHLPEAPTWELLGQAITDRMFRVPGVRLAEARAEAGARTFHYEFRWPSNPGRRLRAYHCLDLPFIFDNLEAEGVAIACGDAAPPHELADAMHGAFVSFIKTGDPGWKPYDLATRTTMLFDATSAPADDALRFERELWAGIV